MEPPINSAENPVDSPTQGDRRRRLEIPITVVRPNRGNGPKTFFGYARNISQGGLGIGTLRPREPGSRHLVEFALPAPLSKTVTCSCEVVWGRSHWNGADADPGMGLRFLDAPAEVRRAIDEWIREQSWAELSRADRRC